MTSQVAWCKDNFLSTDGEDGDSYSDIAANSQHDLDPSLHPTSQRLALENNFKWIGNGVRLRVAFLDKNTPLGLQKRIVRHMNSWSEFCNVRFTLINDPLAAEVRVSFSGKVLDKVNDGYWSCVGQRVLRVTDKRKPTMMLTGFDKELPDGFRTTVRHETGHILGFVHEQLRPEIVRRIDRDKAIREYRLPPNRWSAKTTIENVLEPLRTNDDSNYSLSGVPDVHSIMCYPINNSILKDGMKEPPIEGGEDFSNWDKEYAAKWYPIPKKAARVMSKDKQTVGIAAVGEQLYLYLSSGKIYRVDNGRRSDVGKVGDPIDPKLLRLGLLYGVSRWNGVDSNDIKKWSEINKKEDNAHFHDKCSWKQLQLGKDAPRTLSTKTHLFRQDEAGKIYKSSKQNTDWERIDQFKDTVQIATNWNHVYQHRKNGEIWVYTGDYAFWFRVFKQQGTKPFRIEASEDRLFRIEAHDGRNDVWVNDDNTEQGWKPLEIKKNFSSFVYTGGFVYEFIQDTGEVTRYTGIC